MMDSEEEKQEISSVESNDIQAQAPIHQQKQQQQQLEHQCFPPRIIDYDVDDIQPIPTADSSSTRTSGGGSSRPCNALDLPPGAYHTNHANTSVRAAGTTPLCVLGAELRMANKPTNSPQVLSSSCPSQREEPLPVESSTSITTWDDDSSVVVANLVDDLLKDLPLAKEYDPEEGVSRRSSRRSSRSETSSRHCKTGTGEEGIEDTTTSSCTRHYWKALFVWILMMVIITIVLVSTQANATDTDTYASEEEISPQPSTTFPTSTPREVKMLHLLPEDTKTLIYEDPTSHQAQAFQWMLNDPNDRYTEERIVQRFVLTTLFYSTSGNTWRNSTNWLSYQEHECAWYTRSTFAMKETLQFVYDGYLANFQEPVPPAKCNQEGIYQHLWLDSNDLAGTIPDEIYLLSSLQSMSLGLNPELEGQISSKLGRLTNLQGLALYHNQHGGSIPSQIALLTKLEALGLNYNGHTGTIPKEFYTKLTNLKAGILNRNHLQGSLPTSIQNLSNLKWFLLDENNLVGSLPSQLATLTSLEWLAVSSNRFSGEVPTELGTLSNMLMFSVANNQFGGQLPTELGLMTSTTLLSFRENQFTGVIPTQYGKLTNLTLCLHLEDNPGLTGKIPSQLGLLTNLQELLLVNNNHSGQIPSQLGLLTNLIQLSLGNNTLLSGTVPEALVALTDLYALSIEGNPMLSGVVPEALCHINGTCIGGSLNPCDGGQEVGLTMDCTELLCGCGCDCKGNMTPPYDG